MHQNRLHANSNFEKNSFFRMKLLFSIFTRFFYPVTAQFPPGRGMGGMGGLPMGAGLGINDAQLEKEWAQRNDLFEIGRKYIFEPEFNDQGMIMPPANLMSIEDLQKLGSGKIEFDKENMFHVEAGFHKIDFTKNGSFCGYEFS